MRLTPLDIRKQEFSHKLRGYDADEVNAFLQMLANQWEELQDENRRQEEKIREIDGKLRHYEKVEEALQEALQTARQSSRTTLENAEEKASIMINRAEARADEIKQEAERERHDLKRETAKLSGRRAEIVTRLRAFLMSEMELLARYEGDDPIGFIKLLPMEESTMRRLSERLEADETPLTEQPVEEPDLRATDRAWEDAPHKADVDAGPPEPEPPAYFSSMEPPSVETSPANESDGSPRRQQEDRHDEHEGAPASEAEKPEGDDAEEEGVIEGPGWTARTVVSRPSEQQGPPPKARPESGHDEDESDDESNPRASSDEIEKIRRILSGLD